MTDDQAPLPTMDEAIPTQPVSTVLWVWFKKLYHWARGEANVNTATTTTTLQVVDNFYYPIDCTSNNVAVALPPVSANHSKKYLIKKIDSSTHAVTITAGTGDTIDGASSVTISTQWATVFIVSDGVHTWHIINTSTTIAPWQPWINVKDYGAVGNGSTDDTTAINLAISTNPGRTIYFPAGSYKITSTIQISSAVHLTCDFGAVTILLATQNQYGVTVGDGTAPTRTACFNTTIENLLFVPFAGVAVSTTGGGILLNYTAYVKILGVQVYGLDSGTRKFNAGMVLLSASEFLIRDCIIQGPNAYGFYLLGAAGASTQTTSGRIDFCEVTSTTVGIALNSDTSGISISNYVAYGMGAYRAGIGITPACIYMALAGTTSYNIFIEQPDLEIETGTQGIQVHTGSEIQIVGGWIGAGTGINTSALQVDSGANSVQVVGVQFAQTYAYILGTQVSFSGCDFVGDTATTIVAIYTDVTATYMQVVGCRFRQFTYDCIDFSSHPTFCMVNGCTFIQNSGGHIISGNYANGPQIKGCQSDTAYAQTSAANMTGVEHGRYGYQFTGATQITTIPLLGIEQILTVQAGAGGIAFTNAGNILGLPASPYAVAAFATITFYCEGNNWFYQRG